MVPSRKAKNISSFLLFGMVPTRICQNFPWIYLQASWLRSPILSTVIWLELPISLTGCTPLMVLYTSSICYLLNPPVPQPFPCIWIWKLKTLTKLIFFFWICAHNRLPTRAYLHNNNIVANPVCEVCHIGNETTKHIFLDCYIAKKFWLHV